MSTDLHARLGHRPGNVTRSCGCGRRFKGMATAFKCFQCADLEIRLMGLDEDKAGELPRYDAWKPREK
jgi:hypothetical protein